MAEISKQLRIVGWTLVGCISLLILLTPYGPDKRELISIQFAQRVMLIVQFGLIGVIPFRFVFVTENFGRGVFLGWGMFVSSYAFGMICGVLGIVEFDGIGMIPSVVFGWVPGLLVSSMAVAARWFTRIRIVRPPE